MKRIVPLLFVVALMPCAAFAETYNYTSVSTDGNASVHITQDVSDQSNTTVIVNGQTAYSGNNTMPVRLAPTPSPAPAISRSSHSSETHVTQRLETRNGSSSGSVHIYRAENGAVVEDRVIPITGSANAPVTTTLDATGPASADPDTLSGFFSHLAETAKPQWRGLRIFGPDAPMISASTSAHGLLSFSVSEHQSPLEQFFNRIFSFLHF